MRRNSFGAGNMTERHSPLLFSDLQNIRAWCFQEKYFCRVKDFDLFFCIYIVDESAIPLGSVFCNANQVITVLNL